MGRMKSKKIIALAKGVLAFCSYLFCAAEKDEELLQPIAYDPG